MEVINILIRDQVLDFFCRANTKIDWRFWSRKGYKNASMYIMVKIFAWDKPWAQVNWQKKICDFSQIKFTRSCDIWTQKKVKREGMQRFRVVIHVLCWVILEKKPVYNQNVFQEKSYKNAYE